MTNHDKFAYVFSTRVGQEFDTAQIIETMLANTDIKHGSIRPNDHAKGNMGQCHCVGSARQIFDRIERGVYLVRNFDATTRDP